MRGRLAGLNVNVRQVGRLADPQLEQALLQRVRVLVFVDARRAISAVQEIRLDLLDTVVYQPRAINLHGHSESWLDDRLVDDLMP